MYDFHYETMKPKYGDNLKLCCMDTDSYICDIWTDDVYKDMKVIINEFDTSAYPKDNTNENYNDKELINDNNDVENNENSIENSDVIENVVFESNDEVGECDNEMLMCAYELERERGKRI